MKNLLVVYDAAEKEVLPQLAQHVNGARLQLVDGSTVSASFVAHIVKQKKFDGVLVCTDSLLYSLAGADDVSRSDFAGSLFEKDGVEFLILPPLISAKDKKLGYNKSILHTVAHMPHLISHYVSKLTAPELWPKMPEFKWAVGTPENLEQIYEAFKECKFISCDIETRKDPLYIRMVGFTGVWLDGGTLSMFTVVIPWEQCEYAEVATLWTQRFLDLPAGKIFQNGKYDNAYFARFGLTCYNWTLDTLTQYHGWYAELPKDLGAIAAYCMRDSIFWKGLSKSGDGHTMRLYNALDCYATACSSLFMLMRAPGWAQKNFQMKHPLSYVAHMCEMRGIKRDTERLMQVKEELTELHDTELAALRADLGMPQFNPSSPTQVGVLLQILGHTSKSTGKTELEKCAYQSAWNAHFIGRIKECRRITKLMGTYVVPEKDFEGRFLYGTHPCGTETGRWASDDSAFWCGQNIMNIPRGKLIKQTCVADDGFMLAECDSEQAESRDMAHLAGDEKLIAAVTGPKDFHSLNTSEMFMVPYESVWDTQSNHVRDKVLRDLGKRVNHGVNYQMGEAVLVDTMGYKSIDLARAALKLPGFYSYLKVAGILIAKYHATYPHLSRVHYPRMKALVSATRKLTGSTGWTRYFFGDVTTKRVSNQIIAHSPQSVNALRLDKALIAVLRDIALHPVHADNFKLLTPIHDSIFFQVRIGHEYLIESVRKAMEVPITAEGSDGKVRTYIVPAAAKAGKAGMGAARWSECE